MSKSGGREISPVQTALQIGLSAAVFYLWSTPFIEPIKLLVVLLHEMSHGLMALATGGTVHDIRITPDQGGTCHSDGGNAVLIAGAGYLGSMFFGGLILRASRGGPAVPCAYALLTLLLLGAAVTCVHDTYSRTFALVLGGSFIFLGLLAPSFVGALGLRVVGTVSCFYAIFDIYSDLLAAGHAEWAENDARTFSHLTGVPEGAVGLLWFLVSVVFFVAILKTSIEAPPAKPAPAAAGTS